MANDRECVDYACECIRLARLTDDPEIRDRLMDMARSCWLLRSDLISSMNVAASTTTLSTPVMATGAQPDLALAILDLSKRRWRRRWRLRWPAPGRRH
jgi:hypothetical protein